MSEKLNVVIRLNGDIYKSFRFTHQIYRIINNIKFANRDPDYMKSYVLGSNIFGKLAPVDGGILVIDYDNNKIIAYQNAFIPGTIERHKVTPELQAFYDAGKILLDQIDYMLDMRPFRNQFFNCKYKSDGRLAIKLLEKLGFQISDEEMNLWEQWLSTTE